MKVPFPSLKKALKTQKPQQAQKLRSEGSASPDNPQPFDGLRTQAFDAMMNHRAPLWVASMLAGTQREKLRIRGELGNLKGAIPLLMKQRNGGKWTPAERQQLLGMVRSMSSVSPYLLIWVVPGSMLILPFLAWHLDVRRKHRAASAAAAR